MPLTRIPDSLPILVAVMAVCATCGRHPAGPADTPTNIIVLFPTESSYDRDGDGLLDLEIAFSDSTSNPVDIGSLHVTSDRAVTRAARDANLVEIWKVVAASSSRVTLEETLPHLLPRGISHLTVSIENRAGGTATRTFTVPNLPPAHLHTMIDLGAQHALATSEITIDPRSMLAYVTTEEFTGSAISIVALETLVLEGVVRTPDRGFSRTAFDSLTNRLYVMSIDEPLIGVFDLSSETFLQPIDVSNRGIGLALSHRRGELFAALEVEGPSNGFLSVVTLAQSAETDLIDLGIQNLANPGLGLGISQLALDAMETRIFAPTGLFTQQGLLEIELSSGSVVSQLDLWPEHPTFLGHANDIVRIDDRLVLTSSSPTGRGRVVVVSPTSPSPLRFGYTGQFLEPNRIDPAPDRTEWALTLLDTGFGRHGVQLMDAGTLNVIWEHPIPSISIGPEGVAFVPDGSAFLVAGGRENRLPSPSPSELYVFLRRPR